MVEELAANEAFTLPRMRGGCNSGQGGGEPSAARYPWNRCWGTKSYVALRHQRKRYRDPCSRPRSPVGPPHRTACSQRRAIHDVASYPNSLRHNALRRRTASGQACSPTI